MLIVYDGHSEGLSSLSTPSEYQRCDKLQTAPPSGRYNSEIFVPARCNPVRCPYTSDSYHTSRTLPDDTPRRNSSRAVSCDIRYTPDNRSDTAEDRKSTRLNSSHVAISYAVFCLK